MLNKTKITLAVLGLSISSIGMAGMYAAPPAPACVPGDVTVPCEAKKWDIGIRALYLKSLYDADAVYATAINRPDYFDEIDNDWGWGYRIEGSYHYNTGSDITMNWTHYDTDAYQSGLQSPFITIAPIPLPNAQFNLDMNNLFDQVNLVLGQHVDMGLVKNARFYGGLQYARIRTETLSRFTNIPFTNFQRTTYSDMKGVGPVVGIDYSYDVSHGFSVVANAATSVLYGNGHHSTIFISAPSSVVVASFNASKKLVVPSLEAKLGVNYAYVAPMGTLNLEAGYQALNYFNAFQTLGTSGLNSLTDTDFGLYGPYFGVNWVGNA